MNSLQKIKSLKKETPYIYITLHESDIGKPFYKVINEQIDLQILKNNLVTWALFRSKNYPDVTTVTRVGRKRVYLFNMT